MPGWDRSFNGPRITGWYLMDVSTGLPLSFALDTIEKPKKEPVRAVNVTFGPGHAPFFLLSFLISPAHQGTVQRSSRATSFLDPLSCACSLIVPPDGTRIAAVWSEWSRGDGTAWVLE